MIELWRVQILVSGHAWIIHGDENVLRSSYESLKDAIESGGVPTMITFDGFFNTADRAELSMTVRVAEVQALDFGRIS